MINIVFRKTDNLAQIPTRGSKGAAGYDLTSLETITLNPGQRHLFKTGISLSISPGTYGRIAPRSGLAYKAGIDVLAGVIDEDYRGEIGVILINLGQSAKEFKAGDKIAQIIFEKYFEAHLTEVDILPQSNRGSGGYGSTDVNP